MPILNKTINDVITEEMVNNVNSNRLLVMYVCDKNNKPMLVMDNAYVRNNYEMENAKEKWENLCKEWQQVVFKNNGDD